MINITLPASAPLRACSTCKRSLALPKFLGEGISPPLFKLCDECRAKGREANNRRKEKRSQQAKEYYQLYKEKVSNRNKEYRKNNKEKLKEYESNPVRRAKNAQHLKQKRKEDPCRFIFYSAKKRAKESNLPFEITKEDIQNIYPIDDKCPILGIDLYVSDNNSTDHSPTLDKVIPEKGYIKNNIVVVSYRANRIKNDASLEEIEKLYNFLKNRSI